MKTFVTFFLVCISLLTSSNLYSQGFWKQCNGPNQGIVHAIAFNSHGECFIATDPGGVYKTPDDGLNWHQTTIEYYPTYAIIVAANQNIITGGTANFVSTDNGYTWNPPQFINTGGSVFQFYCFSGSPSGVIYAGVQGGVFKSADNGLTFDTTHQIFMEAVNDICVNSSGDIFIATGGAGIFRSTNGGDVWESKNTGIGTDLITNVTVNRTTGDLYAKTYSDEAKVYRSTNNGESWFVIYDPGPEDGAGGRGLLVTPSGDIFTTGWGTVIHSTDNGAGWNIKHVYYRSYMTDIKLAPSGRLFVCSDEAGIFRSDNNGGTWMAMSNGVSLTRITSLATGNSNQLYAGTDWNGLWKSTDRGDSWSRMNLTSHIIHCVTVAPNGYVYAGTYTDWWHEGGLFRSTNSGESWQKFELENEVVTAVGYNSQGHIFASVYSKVFRSTDNGDTWQMISGNTVYSYSKVIVQAPSGNMFIGGETGIYKSTDNGATWYPTAHSGWEKYITSIVCASGGDIYAAGKGAWKSTDQGETWTALPVPEPSDYYDIALTTGGNLYLCSVVLGYGVYRSGTANIEWTGWNGGLNFGLFKAFALDSDGYLYVGSQGRSVFRTRTTTTDGEEVNEHPETFGLAQNYPNPFNPGTVISYQIPVRSNVTIKLFDITGNEIGTLINEEKDAGSYEYKFMAGDYSLSSGVYFYQIRAGEFISTGKMILMK